MKPLLLSLTIIVFFSSCTNRINYTPEHIEQTSGRYLYNQDEVIEVFYENNKLFLKFKGAEKIKPVALDTNTFFMDQIYTKLRFVQHPETKKRYLSILNEDNENIITYDYLKVEASYKTPSMHLKDKEYEQALLGFLEIKKQDSTSIYINESDFNSLGYELIRKRDYENAIEILKINVALYPDSENVYDSLGEAYLKSGDSLQAYTNYSKAYNLNKGNDRAKNFIDAYNKN